MTEVTVTAAGSGVCELTNRSRLGIQRGALEETTAKTECFSQKGNTVPLSMRKLMSFLSIKACKLILVATKNKITVLKMSAMCLL